MDSATPILDLEAEPPAPRTNVSLKGLLIAVPAAIGLVIVALGGSIFVLVIANENRPQWFSDFSPLARAVELTFRHGPFVAMGVTWLASFFGLVVHEAGHAIGAVLVGWRIIEFRAAPVVLNRETGNWKLRLRWRIWPAGLVVPEYSPVGFHSKYGTMALAGPFANLCTAILVLMFFRPERWFFLVLTLHFILWSGFAGVFNLLPIRARDLELDGYAAMVVCRKPARLAARIAAIRMREHVRSKRPVESMNQRWVALSESVQRASLQNVGGMCLAYAYWAKLGKYDRSAAILEKILRLCGNADKRLRGLIFAECTVLSGIRGHEKAAKIWKDRALKLDIPAYLAHWCNSRVAWVEGDMKRAHDEALQSKASVAIPDEKAREFFLRGCNEWIAELEQKLPGRSGS
jgi:hypothetical protein